MNFERRPEVMYTCVIFHLFYLRKCVKFPKGMIYFIHKNRPINIKMSIHIHGVTIPAI
jgi:hypothetical protein